MQLNPLIKLDPSKLPLAGGIMTGAITLADLANALNSDDYSLQMESGIADGAGAIGYTFDTANALGTAGAKIASFQTNSVEKAYITGDGDLNLSSALQFSATDYIYESGSAFIVGDSSSGTGSGAVSLGRGNSLSSGINNIAVGLSITNTSLFEGIGIGSGHTVQGIQDVALGLVCTTNNGGGAFGKNCTADQVNTSAFGSSATASASSATAFGRTVTATQIETVAMGFACDATGIGAVAMGSNNDASGDTSFALGRLCIASATNAVAIGRNVDNSIASSLQVGASNTAKITMLDTGLLGLAGVTNPTARLHLLAGAAAANEGPLKFTSGVNLTAVEAGTMEFDGTELYFTPTSIRYVIAFLNRINTWTENQLIADTSYVVFDKAAGNGIKVDTTTPTFGFADLLGDQFSKNTGATKPTLASHNGAVQAWQFGDGDEAYLTYHIPHDYVPGSDVFIHVHWSQTSTTATGGTLDFKYFAEYAKGHNQATGSIFTATPITATFSSIDINDGGAGLSQRQQHLTEVIISGVSATSALFDRDDFEPDGVIELTFEMDANNLTNSVTVLDPFIHYVDIHYQTTGIIGTKDKAPDFYA